MTFTINKLQQKNALIIADDWKYDDPYSFYDMTADLDDYNEIVNETLRNVCNYFEVIANDELKGFFSITLTNNDIEIGLGLRPDCCGKGIGRGFVDCIINYIDVHYNYNALILSVASFNKRAIKVYEACGFVQQETFIQETNGGMYDFIKMIRRRRT